MRKSMVTFERGTPLPAAKINSLVGSTAEVSVAAKNEHSPSGLHLGVRFEFAAGIFKWDGGGWSLVFGDRIDGDGSSQEEIRGVVDHTSAPAVSRHNTIGIIAQDEHGREVVCSGFQQGESETISDFYLYPRPDAEFVFVTLIARRMETDPE